MDEQDQEHKTHIIKKVVKVIKRPIAVKAPESVAAAPAPASIPAPATSDAADFTAETVIPPALQEESPLPPESLVPPEPIVTEDTPEFSDEKLPEAISENEPIFTEVRTEEEILPEEIVQEDIVQEDIVPEEAADYLESVPKSEPVVAGETEIESIPEPEPESEPEVAIEPAPELTSESEEKVLPVSVSKSIFDDEDEEDAVPPSVVEIKDAPAVVASAPVPEESAANIDSSAPKSIFDDDDDGDSLPVPPVHTHEVRDIHDFAEDISIPESYQAKEASNPEIPVAVSPAVLPSAPKIPPAPVTTGLRVTPPPSVGLRTPPPPPLKTNASHMFQEVHTDFNKEPAKPPESHTRPEEIKNFPEEKAEYKQEPAANNSAYSADTRYPNTENISSGLYDDNFAVRFNLPPKVLTTKYMSFIFGGILLFGIILGAFMGGGDSCSNQPAGLTGVIANPEVPRGRMRCGIAEKGQGCVLYLMNYQRRDVQAKDFYPLVAQMTGVQRFQIETGNMRYAYTTIKPGYIAQFNVPPVR